MKLKRKGETTFLIFSPIISDATEATADTTIHYCCKWYFSILMQPNTALSTPLFGFPFSILSRLENILPDHLSCLNRFHSQHLTLSGRHNCNLIFLHIQFLVQNLRFGLWNTSWGNLSSNLFLRRQVLKLDASLFSMFFTFITNPLLSLFM